MTSPRTETPSDVAVGLAWLLAQDPARPPAQAYRAGTEAALAAQNLDSFVDTDRAVACPPALGTGPGLRDTSIIFPGQKIRPAGSTSAIREELPPTRPTASPRQSSVRRSSSPCRSSTAAVYRTTCGRSGPLGRPQGRCNGRPRFLLRAQAPPQPPGHPPGVTNPTRPTASPACSTERDGPSTA